MLNEVVKILFQKGGLFVDCTFGGGGYSNTFSNSKHKSYWNRQIALQSQLQKIWENLNLGLYFIIQSSAS